MPSVTLSGFLIHDAAGGCPRREHPEMTLRQFCSSSACFVSWNINATGGRPGWLRLTLALRKADPGWAGRSTCGWDGAVTLSVPATSPATPDLGIKHDAVALGWPLLNQRGRTPAEWRCMFSTLPLKSMHVNKGRFCPGTQGSSKAHCTQVSRQRPDS